MNFLVVDDQASIRGAIKDMLNKMGYMKIDEADDGSLGLDMLKANPYDLVISDNHMNNVSGIEFLKEIRNTSSIKDIPFMLVTTEGSKETVLEAIKYKVSGYILKPFKFDDFKEKLASIGIHPVTGESEH